MALDSKRKSAEKYVNAMAKPFSRFSPNSISAASVVFAVAFFISYYIGNYFLYLALAFVILSAVFDAIDGAVARIKGQSSKRGDLVDHFLDRISDIFFAAGIGLSIYSQPIYAFLGLEGILLTSYMGTQSQALGVGRDYSGIVGRADRIVAIVIFTVMQILLPFSYTYYVVFLTPSTIVLLWFFFAGNFTAAQRFVRLYRKI